MSNSDDLLTGRLSIYVAFDWGEEIDLELARKQGAGVVLDMARRPRTPRSIAFRPPPLRFPLGPVVISMPGLDAAVRSAEATVFDFAGVSVALQIPFSMPRDNLRVLAASLNDPEPNRQIVETARAVLEPLYHKLLPAITKPEWDAELSEEYFVFLFPPAASVAPDSLLADHANWLAGLLRLEDEPLSSQEVTEALRLTLRYGADDVFIPDWGAAVLVDREGESDETLQVIEFANLRLLQYRHIDRRIDDILGRADELVRKASRSRLPAWRGHQAALRSLGELRLDAGAFERIVTALRLVGDQYLARVYKLLATRFHLPEWEWGIQRKLEILEGVYQVAADQSGAFRAEFLEVLIVLLILIEIVISMYKH